MKHRAARRPSASRREEWRHSFLLVAAALLSSALFFSVHGTEAAWTKADVTNPNNSVAAAGIVILRSVNGATSCRSDADPSNTSTCTTIDPYGGTTATMFPGDTRTIDLVFSNVGNRQATSFSLVPGTCTSTGTLSGFTATNLCTASGNLDVAISCSPGSTYVAGSAWTDVRQTGGPPPAATLTHAAASAELNPGASWTCRIVVTLATTASANAQGVQVSHALQWTLSA